MSKEIVIREPAELITLAIEKGSDLGKLEHLLNIQREWNKDVARNAYHKAMSEFKANPPIIKKNKDVSFGSGKAAYKHATLYNVVKECSAALSKYNLSASWTTNNQTPGMISVTCVVTHELGHSESTALSAPSDVSGNKNAIQAVGSTVTYLQRYTLLALLGLATMDQDDDGQAAVTEFVDQKQLSQLYDLCANREVDQTKFCQFFKVESLEKIPAKRFNEAKVALEAKKKK